MCLVVLKFVIFSKRGELDWIWEGTRNYKIASRSKHIIVVVDHENRVIIMRIWHITKPCKLHAERIYLLELFWYSDLNDGILTVVVYLLTTVSNPTCNNGFIYSYTHLYTIHIQNLIIMHIHTYIFEYILLASTYKNWKT